MMIPVIELNTTDVPTRGRAYAIPFRTQSGINKVIYVGLSVAEVRDGKFWVKEFILQPNQDGLRIALREGWLPQIGTAIQQTAPPVVENNPVVGRGDAVIKKGFFTVESVNDRHRTFRIKTSARSGKTVIGLMTGSNNLKDYSWFGYVNGSQISFWNNAYDAYQMRVTLPIGQNEIRECFAAISANAGEAGLRFSRKYANCSRCGKVLTTPESLDAGIGPECRGMGYGASRRRTR